MIIFAVHFNQLRFEVHTDLGKNVTQVLDGVTIKNMTPIFSHKDQVDVHLKYTVPTRSIWLLFIHRPSIICGMKRLQAFKFELRSNGEQARLMRRFAGSCRFVFNKALALQKARYDAGEKKLGYAGLCKELTQWKRDSETCWLSETHSQPLQQTLKDLERAYKNFFEKRAAFPAFKKRGQHDAFRFPQGVTLDEANARIKLPRLGWIRYRKSRDVLGTVKNVTVSLEAGRWYASIQTEREMAEPVHPASSMVGVDMGVTNFATLSYGSSVEPINSFRRLEKRLAHEQRKLSRRVKFSVNWKKQKSRISRLHR
jgi:putative transposase